MREIRFRAWHPEIKDEDGYGTAAWMDYDPDWQNVSAVRREKRDVVGAVAEDHIQLERARLNKIFSDTTLPLMQFTGLKDKNGKEIYEGDVISTRPLFAGDKPHFTVEWNKDEHTKMTGWMQRNVATGLGVLDDSIIEQGEIIGNIYENPELLSSKEV